MAFNPAHKIIMRLGGEKAVAKLLGLHESGVYRWHYPRERGGCQGRIPARHIPRLIDAARERGMRLSANDFFKEPTEV
jgi:DNA-binding transcriptional regulator YdaS (Cro superfamily)